MFMQRINGNVFDSIFKYCFDSSNSCDPDWRKTDADGSESEGPEFESCHGCELFHKKCN